MRKPLHEASLNHVLKSEGGAPESGAAQRPRVQSGQAGGYRPPASKGAHVNAMATAQDDVTAN
jgi:hypothetical protein